MKLIMVGMALVYALVLCASGKTEIQAGIASASLASYSETRSFRDALDGRSMEEVLSGPVEKDTSSYGDRTSPSLPSMASSSEPQSASPMMLTIPANGNLSPSSETSQQQQTVDEQTKSFGSEGDLEREAGPMMSTIKPMDYRQRLTEKKYEPQMVSDGPLSTGNARQIQKYGRIQQSQSDDRNPEEPASTSLGTKANPSANEQGFDEEMNHPAPGKGGYGRKNEPQETHLDSSQIQTPRREQQVPNQETIFNKEKEQHQSQQQTQSPPINGNAYSSSKQSDGLNQQAIAKQQAMAAMLMSMNNGYKYSRGSASSGASKTYSKPMMMQMDRGYDNLASKMSDSNERVQSNIFDGTMTPEGNKLAKKSPHEEQYQYEQKQKQYSMQNADQSPMLSTMKAGNSQAQRYGASPMMRGESLGVYRPEKKLSPSMVNAMLNKMLESRQNMYGSPLRATNQNQNMRPAAISMLMKSPAGAALLTDIVMPQVNGAIAGMPDAKRDQYKRMMADVIMQQAREANSESIQNHEAVHFEHQHQSDDSDGVVQPGMRVGVKSAESNAGSRGYQSNLSRAPSPVAQMMSVLKAPSTWKPAASEQQQQQMMMMMIETPAQPSYTTGEANMDSFTTEKLMPQEMYQHDNSAEFGNNYPSKNMKPDMSVTSLNGAGSRRSMPDFYQMMRAAKSPQTNSMSMMNGQFGSKIPNEEQIYSEAYDNMDNMKQQHMIRPNMPSQPMYTELANSALKRHVNQETNDYMKPGNTGGSVQPSDSMPSNRPFMPMQYSYGVETMQKDMIDQQQQQENYNSAPMGIAEPFAFDFKTEDDYGNGHYRKEESDKNGVVRGSYGYMDVNGLYRHVDYVADENGFRANIKSNEPGMSVEPSRGSHRQNSPEASPVNSMQSSMVDSNQQPYPIQQ